MVDGVESSLGMKTQLSRAKQGSKSRNPVLALRTFYAKANNDMIQRVCQPGCGTLTNVEP
jgi:hypothetical protein